MDVASSILWSESDREQPVEMGDIDEIALIAGVEAQRTGRCGDAGNAL